MTPEDYRVYWNCEELSKKLNLEIVVTSDYFTIVNDIAEIHRFCEIVHIWYWLKGFEQCKRIEDCEYNRSYYKDED